MQKVCEGLRIEGEEQGALQQQLEQQQAQLAAADEQHAAALKQMAALRLTALDGTTDKLLEQVSCADVAVLMWLLPAAPGSCLCEYTCNLWFTALSGASCGCCLLSLVAASAVAARHLLSLVHCSECSLM